jgi:GDPmannose 4,6-dehydratase
VKKKAIIFGASSQAGYYLFQLLVSKGYEVTGTKFRNTVWNSRTITMDVRNHHDVRQLIQAVQPDEIYNLASMIAIPESWKYPVEYVEVNLAAATNMLSTVMQERPTCRFFQAGSAEIFRQNDFGPQSEKHEIRPRNPYGISKAALMDMVRVYRDSGLFACTGILFNMESPRRPDTFFSVKVAKAVAAIKNGKQDKLVLGKLNAKRDWGWTEEYVVAMWKMLQADPPLDFVIGTGECHSCFEFVKEAFSIAGVSMDKLVYEDDPYDMRRMDSLWADPTKINFVLNWKAKTLFHGVVRKLVEAEMEVYSGQSAVAR